MQQRYKPTSHVIEAMQFTGKKTNIVAIQKWVNTMPVISFLKQLVLRYPDGDVSMNVGDWVIKGENGEFYSCKDDIFQATYEPTVGRQS